MRNMTCPWLVKGLLLLTSLGQCAAKQQVSVILERDNLKYIDTKYVEIHEHIMSRANRTSPYMYNVNASIYLPWYSNVTVEMKGYENHNNEYKESVLSFKHDACELFQKTNFFVKVAKNYGNLPSKCPMENGLYVKNLYIKEEYLPPFFPQTKWMVSFRAYTTKQKIPIVELEVYFQVVNVAATKKKNKKN